MRKIAAILNVIAGSAIALVGGFVVIWCGTFLSAAPRDHLGLVTGALAIITIGIYLVIGGLGRVRLGTANLNQRGPSTE